MNIFNMPSKVIRGEITHEKLIDVFDKAEDHKAWRKDAINAFFDDPELYEKMRKEGKIDIMDFNIIQLIFAFTEVPINQENFELYKKVINEINQGYVKDIKLEDKLLTITTKLGKIKARRITDFLVSDSPIEPLENKEKRKKQCHWSSIWLSNKLQEENIVCTGYAQDFAKKTRYLHTWVEVPMKGKSTLVLDPANNLVMRKSKFYLLFHIWGPVHKIKDEELVQDYKILNTLYEKDEWYTKLYLSNRKAAIKEYEKIIEEEK